MKLFKILTIFSLTLLTNNILCAQNTKFGPHPNGFGGMQWETNIDTLKTMKFVKKIDNFLTSSVSINVYVRQEDNVLITPDGFKKIEYYFWGNKLIGAVVYTSGIANFHATKDSIIKRLEKNLKWEKQPTSYSIEEFSCFTKYTNLVAHYNKSSQDGKFIFISKKISEQLNLSLLKKETQPNAQSKKNVRIAYGVVKRLSSKQIIIQKVQKTTTKKIENQTFTIDPQNIGLQNVPSLKDIAIGDKVNIIYYMQGTNNIIVLINVQR